MACSSSRDSHSRSLHSLLLCSLIAVAAVTPGCSAAPAKASRLGSSDPEQVKDVETAAADIKEAADHAAAAKTVANPDGTAQTLIDELFRGTWGAFILKERPETGRSKLSPPPAEHAIDETVASTVSAEDDNDDDGIGRDHPTSVEAQLLLDDVDDDAFPDHGDTEAAGRHGMAADVATGSGSSKETKHSGGTVHRGRGGGSPNHGKAFVSSAVTSDRAIAGIRSHWRRGHDRATVNLQRNAAEPGDEVQQSAEAAQPPKQQQEEEEEEPRLHHVVAFHVTEADPKASVAPGEGGSQQEHRKSSTAATVEMAGSLPSSSRLADHGLPIGHWGKFLPSVSEATMPRRAPAVAGGNHDGEHWGRAAPSRSSRSRRPPSHEGKLTEGNSSGTIAAMPSFQLLRLRPLARAGSVGFHANRDAAGDNVIARGGNVAIDEDSEQRQQQEQHQPVANAGDEGAKHPSHTNGHEGRLLVNHRLLSDSLPLPTREGTRSGITLHRASSSIGSSGGVRAAGEGAVAADIEHVPSPSTSRWTLRGSGQRQQQGPAGLGGWRVEDGWVAGDASSSPVAHATVASRPVRIDRPRSRVMLEGRFVA